MAGFAREQVCTYMCPYARFQSAMFDESTLIISYDEQRGEKRGKHKKGDSWEGRGHCIDCTACVQVCPMGIDIREGLQMECIACGLCVDACNNIMDKVELPRGLIRYDTTRLQKLREKGIDDVIKIIRPRSIYYASIIAIVGLAMLYSLINRSMLELHVLHDRNPVFVQLSSGEIRNGYVLKILNKTHDHHSYKISVEGIRNPKIKVKAAGDTDANTLYVPADSVGSYHVYISSDIPPDAPRDIIFKIENQNGDMTDMYRSVFITRKE